MLEKLRDNSVVECPAHNRRVEGSIPSPATKYLGLVPVLMYYKIELRRAEGQVVYWRDRCQSVERRMDQLEAEIRRLKSGKLDFEVWHPINGKWTHICQMNNEGGVDYYTDGVKEVL